MARQPVLQDQTIQNLRSQGNIATANDLGVSAAFMDSLVRKDIARRVGSIKVTPGRGRPQRTFGLTRRGQGRARTLARQS